MAKLPHLAAGRIWRTVVVAGAMLGTPAIAIADAPANPCAAPKKDDAKKTDAPKKDDTTAKKDDTKKDGAKKPAPKPAPKRPRSDGSDRPTGRGFILS